MGERNLIIVCDGKEISFGMCLKHLLKYEENGIIFHSSGCQMDDVEIYSISAYHHAETAKDVFRIFIGNTQIIPSAAEKVFDMYGMNLWMDDSTAILRADAGCLTEETYTGFLAFANSKRKEYLKRERAYVKKTEEKNQKWIAPFFVQVEAGGLFGKGNVVKKKLQQQYDCLAFVFYICFLYKE